MNQQAIDEMNAAAGRELNDTELRAFKDRAETAAHDLEAEDPAAWRELPIEERISRTTELAQMRYVAAMKAEHRRKIAWAATARPDLLPVAAKSSAMLTGYVPPVLH